MVQKAAVFGAAVVVAISAPTAMALRTAEEADITLIGIARRDGFEVIAEHRKGWRLPTTLKFSVNPHGCGRQCFGRAPGVSINCGSPPTLDARHGGEEAVMSAEKGIKEINTKQALLLDIERDVDFNGIGMGVLSDGTPYLNQRGLATLCGVRNAHIGTIISSQWAELDQNPHDAALGPFASSGG
jgi:hypothetical protein